MAGNIGNVGVDPAALGTTATTIRDCNKTMESRLTAIKSEVDSLQSSYQSDASAALAAVASQMESRFSELKKSVESFAVYLDDAKANYEKQQAAANEVVSSVSSMFSR